MKDFSLLEKFDYHRNREKKLKEKGKSGKLTKEESDSLAYSSAFVLSADALMREKNASSDAGYTAGKRAFNIHRYKREKWVAKRDKEGW